MPSSSLSDLRLLVFGSSDVELATLAAAAAQGRTLKEALGSVNNIVLNTAPPGAAAIPAGVQEGPGAVSTSRRVKIDLSFFDQFRVSARVTTTASAAAKFAYQYTLDEVSWFYMSGVASGSAPSVGDYVSMAVGGTITGAWSNLGATAKADVILRIVTLDGDGVTTGAVGLTSLQVR